MQHKKSDTVLEEINRYYGNNFLINGDIEKTKAISAKIREKEANCFYGNAVFFDVSKMFCTDGKKSSDSIHIPFTETVYGPYYTFPAGEYTACFDIRGNCKAQISVFSQNIGTIAQHELSLDVAENPAVLNFALDEKTENVEFKITNLGQDELHFFSVTVSAVNLPKPFEINDAVPELSAAERSDSSDNMLSSSTESSNLDAEICVLAAQAECLLPDNTRFKLFKRIIRKIIRPFSFFQITFNNSMVRLLTGLKSQQSNFESAINELYTLNSLNVSAIRQQESSFAVNEEKNRLYCQELDAKLKSLEKNVEQLERSLLLHEKGLREIREITENHEETDNIKHEVGSIWKKISEFDDNFRSSWKVEGNLNANLGNLWNAYSSMRQELFLELNSRISNNSFSDSKTIEPVVKDSAKEKAASQNGMIRLNLGCGPFNPDGYIGVDVRDLSSVDIVADVSKLPFETERVDEIFSSHIIEHFTAAKMRDELLPYWYSLLKPDGVFRVIFPDIKEMVGAYSEGNISFDALATIIMGAQDYQQDYHYAVYCADTVTKMLEEAGFKDITVVALGRENGECLETEISARK